MQRISLIVLSFLLSLILLASPGLGTTVIQVPAQATLQTAINTIPEGGVIEIATGTYVAPSGGFLIFNAGKSFTLRAAQGATVTLSGGGTTQVLRYVNTGSPGGRSVVFEGLTFADGFTNINGRGGGVTVDSAVATFIDCTFSDNVADTTNTGGGGVALFNVASGHFFGCVFDGNSSDNEGGGLRIGVGSKAWVYDSRFTNNLTNVPGHRISAAGGAIHSTSGMLRVANTRFEGNQAGCVGGAIYAIGDFDSAATSVVVANSTFVDNLVDADGGVTCSFTEVGGAIHMENQVEGRILHSRFETNSALIGGAISMYRASGEIDGGTFLGNHATGSGGSSGFGGTIMVNSNDANDASTGNGTINRPSASLTLRKSHIRSRFGAVTIGGNKGACLFVRGDVNRNYGEGGMTQMGTTAFNRATLVVEDTVFADCDVAFDGTTGTGSGGALELLLVDLDMRDSLVIDSDATGTDANGAGLRATVETIAAIQNTTFAYNTAESRAAAILVNGADLVVDGCEFFNNTTSTSGSVIWSNQDLVRNLASSGSVENSVFSNNSGININERDYTNGPINSTIYNNNQFFPSTGNVYRNDLSGGQTVSQLNTVVVNRNVGNTVKSPGADNISPGTDPVLAALVAAPCEILQVNASGDPSPPTDAYLGWAGAGGAVTLDGGGVNTSGNQTAGAGVHTLAVGATQTIATILNGATPAASFSADPIAISGGQSADLEWATTAGTFVDVTIDRVGVTTAAASGMETVTPAETTTYELYLLTESGAVHESVTVYVDEEPPVFIIFEDGFESGDISAW